MDGVNLSRRYVLESPGAYRGMLLYLEKGMAILREEILSKLVEIQYERSDFDFHRSTFQVQGDVVEVFPAHEEAASCLEFERAAEIRDRIQRLEEMELMMR